MMTPRENVMAVYNREQPDYYGDIMAAMALLPDPILMSGSAPQDGLPHKNIWGVTYIWKPGAPGQHPYITDENKVIKEDVKIVKSQQGGINRKLKILLAVVSVLSVISVGFFVYIWKHDAELAKSILALGSTIAKTVA